MRKVIDDINVRRQYAYIMEDGSTCCNLFCDLNISLMELFFKLNFSTCNSPTKREKLHGYTVHQ